MKKIILILTSMFILLNVYAIEVGGHIHEDTIWSPENNPYIITSFLYVDSNVCLTILPGTQVLAYGGNTNISSNFYWTGTGVDNQPVAKKIIVNGTINAIGTPDNPIIFDKYQEDSDYKWGGIYMTVDAPISTFDYCEINNGFACDYAPGQHAYSTVSFGNGLLNISNCSLIDNYTSIGTGNLQMDLYIYKCSIDTGDIHSPPFVSSQAIAISTSEDDPPARELNLIIASCYFTGNSDFTSIGGDIRVLFLFNYLDSFNPLDEQNRERDFNPASVSSYGNYAYNGTQGWFCSAADSTDVVFARRNKLEKNISNHMPLQLSLGIRGTHYVSDNHLVGNTKIIVKSYDGSNSYIYNNIIESNCTSLKTIEFEELSPQYPGDHIRFFNNLVRFTEHYSIVSGAVKLDDTSPLILNNTFINYPKLQSGSGECNPVYVNNIAKIFNRYGSISNCTSSFLNNCSVLSFPDIPELYNVENHVYADPCFADTLNHDYSLAFYSPAIDAGLNIREVPEFDIRYHKRIETFGGTVDIGAYEFGSVYIGGIQGNVYDAHSGQAVDCAKIQILNKLPEFSDSLGNFTYPSGEGVYTVRVSRWDYEDLIIPDVTVLEGAELVLNIPLTRTNASNYDNETSPVIATSFGLKSYPNPFNPANSISKGMSKTQISFTLAQAGHGELAIFNLKGQRVKTLYKGKLASGYHNYSWDGKNSSNRTVSSGIYFYKLKVDSRSEVGKMMIMK